MKVQYFHTLKTQPATSLININLTRRLRVIRNACHFCFALIPVFKVQCRGFGIACFTP
ncbi:TPA: DUF3265 domain-containing protein [Vibrio parahaemolyticus]|nr:DUF3265 domain-containing protein [Vibrio parahaemolyticus]